MGSFLHVSMEHVSMGGWGFWRVGYAPKAPHPSNPAMRGRWWIWAGPWLIGRPDDTW